MTNIRKAGLVCCSNGEPRRAEALHECLVRVLRAGGVEVVTGPCIYAGDTVFSGTAAQRAEQLHTFFRDDTVDAVFDISGGDLANELADRLDFELIAASRARLWGYSDLTCLLNAIYAKTGKASVLYQIKNLAGPCGAARQADFFASTDAGTGPLFQLPFRFLRGTGMEGVVVGGNVRCLLKLAGTPYFPDMTGKLLLLEANSGGIPQMTAYLSQLRQMGVFRQISGLLLGTFTQMEANQLRPTMEELVLANTPSTLPVLKTPLVGHGPDAKAVVIGTYQRFSSTACPHPVG